MKKSILPAFRLLLVLTLLAGVIYPLGMTFLAGLLFPYQANGSMILRDSIVVGSELIGQSFSSDKYFTSRPSAIGYDPIPSSGTNWGPTDKRMKDSAQARAAQFILQNHLAAGTVVPKEMLFASASGVDPHISPEAARLQVERIASARGFDKAKRTELQKLVDDLTEGAQLRLFGEPRVNVLKLNLMLDAL